MKSRMMRWMATVWSVAVFTTTYLPAQTSSPPTITTQPAGAALYWNGTATLSVVADGSAPLAYQWQHYETNLPGASSVTLSFSGFDTNNAGPYRVVVTNDYGAITSEVAQVSIIPSLAPDLVPPDLPVYTYVGGSTEPWNWTNPTNWSPRGYPVGRAIARFVTHANLIPPWSIRPVTNGVDYILFENSDVWIGHGGGSVGHLIVTGGNLNFDAPASNIAIYGGSSTISAWDCQRLELYGGTISMTGSAEGYSDAFINLSGPFVWYGGTWDGGPLVTYAGSQIVIANPVPGSSNPGPKWLSGVVAGDLSRATGSVVVLPYATFEVAGGNHTLSGWGIQNEGRVLWSAGNISLGDPSAVLNAPGAVFQITGGANLTVNSNTVTFLNQGQILKTDNSGTPSLGIWVNHTGTIGVSNGWLAFTAGGVFNSNVFLASGAGAAMQGLAWYSCWGDFNLGDGTLLLNSGTLTGTNSFSSGVFEFSNGAMQDGYTKVGSNGLFRVSGTAQKVRIRHTLDNEGHIEWDDDGTLGGYSSALNNLTGGVFEVFGNPRLTGTAFNNAGLFRKRDGTGVALIDGYGSGSLYNSGIIEIDSGTLRLSLYCTLLPTIQTGPSGVLELINDGYSFWGDFDFGSGWVVLSSGLWRGNNSVGGNVQWTGTQMANGSTTFKTNCFVQVGGPVAQSIVNYALTNAGHIVWTGDKNLGTSGSILYNLPGGTFEAVGNGLIAGMVFNNNGLFRKHDSTGTTTFASPFNNGGTIEVLSGQVSLAGGYSMTSGMLNFGLAGETTFGRISVSGNAPLAGSLRATLLNGYRPATNVSFQVMTFNSESGAFSDLSGLNVGNGRYFELLTSSTSLTLIARATNNPALSSASRLLDGTLQWCVTDEVPGVYALLGSTNLATWDFVTLLTNSTGTLYFVDLAATNIPCRFYRTAPAQ